MMCCKGREKRGQAEQAMTKKEMVERYILQSCKQTEEDSFDQSIDHMRAKIIEYDEEKYEKHPWTLTEWLRVLHTKQPKQLDRWDIHLYREELRRNIRHGILESMRPATWFWLTDIENTQIRKHSADIFQKLKAYPSVNDNEIFKDIKNMDRRYNNAVFDVLRAYANYDNQVGYVNGMHNIVTYLMQSMDPDRYQNLDNAFNNLNRFADYHDRCVFWMTMQILIQHNYRQVFAQQVSFINTDKFNNTLMEPIKKLLERFNKPLNKIISTPLLFLYQKFMPPKEFNRLFDVFIYEGESILLQILLKLLKLSENIIVMFQSEADLTVYLNQSLIPYGQSQLNKNNNKAIDSLLL